MTVKSVVLSIAFFPVYVVIVSNFERLKQPLYIVPGLSFEPLFLSCNLCWLYLDITPFFCVCQLLNDLFRIVLDLTGVELALYGVVENT